jgi:RNA polymerase-binding transcription factor DksA
MIAVGRRRRVERQQFPERKKILQAEQSGDGRTLPQNRRTVGIENSADVMEEIWRAADRQFPRASLGACSGLLRSIRAALARIKGDTFGACLCCRTAIGLRRLTAAPWTPLCIRCQEAAGRNDAEVLRSRSRG